MSSIAVPVRAPAPASRAARPLSVFLLALPVWWVLGLANLGYFLVAGLMLLDLLRRRDWRVPRGFGFWLVFMLWVVLSIVMLGLEASGTLVQGVGDRVIPTIFRIGEYSACTIMLIWALTLSEEELPTRRLGQLLAVALGWSVVGGIAGLLAPNLQFPSPMELLLPGGLSQNPYVSALVHPATAQVQDLFSGGEGVGRPSAPYPYTNTWGNALGILLPFGVALIADRATRPLVRVAAALGLVVSAVATFVSANRGLWLAIVAMAGFFVVLAMARGNRGVIVATCIGGPMAIIALVATPLGTALSERNTSAPSNDIRAFTVARAVEIATDSPVLGYGSTRAQLGSSKSIAVGTSPGCPKCGNMALGTNGQLWFASVGQGFVGAGLFVLFHLAVLWHYRFVRSPLGVAALTSGVAGLVFIFVYDRTVATGCLSFLTIGLLVKVARQENVA